MKLDAGTIQDLHHYALAMMGKDNALDCYSLLARLGAVESALRILTTLDEGEDPDGKWFDLAKENNRIKDEAELVTIGALLMVAVTEWCQENEIDGASGNLAAQQEVHYSEAWDASEMETAEGKVRIYRRGTGRVLAEEADRKTAWKKAAEVVRAESV